MILLISDADPMQYTDREKLRLLYDTYKKKMYVAAKKITGNTPDAEDAVQNAFISVSRSISKINMLDDDALSGYMITIAKNEAYDIVRGRDVTELSDDLPEQDPFSDVNAKIFERDVYNAAVAAIRSLDDRYRAPLYLSTVMGYKTKEIARLLRRNEQTVKGQIARGKKMIISKLKEAGYEL